MKRFIFRVILAILYVVLSMVLVAGMNGLQEWLFVPQSYIMWIFKYPASRFSVVFSVLFFAGLYVIVKYGFWNKVATEYEWLKEQRFSILIAFFIASLTALYIIIPSVAVLKSNSIINYSFLNLKGKVYSYRDIYSINTGVYGKRFYFPFTHKRGDFYYIVGLKDGKKIDLTEMGGAKNPYADPKFILDKLDQQLVKMGVKKVTSTQNFQYVDLGKIYKDKIHNILVRTSSQNE